MDAQPAAPLTPEEARPHGLHSVKHIIAGTPLIRSHACILHATCAYVPAPGAGPCLVFLQALVP